MIITNNIILIKSMAVVDSRAAAIAACGHTTPPSLFFPELLRIFNLRIVNQKCFVNENHTGRIKFEMQKTK